MPKFEDSLETVYACDRAAWRHWLAHHHRDSVGIWLIYYKINSGKPSIQYSEAVQEALCFGWIDSKVKGLDAERYQQIFTPRKPNSVWSRLNKQYLEDLIVQGLMTEAGFAALEVAKQNGSWSSLDAVEALVVPPDLQEALATHPEADQFFAALSKSAKKNILFWITSAKRPETRLGRIQKTVASAAQSQSPLAR